MATSEQFYQPQPFDAPQTDHGELAAQPPTSPRMEQVVTQLAAAHHVDLSQKDANLTVESPDRPGSRWQMSNIDGERIGVTRFQVDEAGALSPDIDMVFAVTEYGWEPREIVHTERPWDEFAQAAQEHELTVFDEQGNLRYDVFTEFWAQKIEQEGGLEEGRVVDAPVDRTGGLSSGVPGPEDPRQMLSVENSLTTNQNLPQSSIGKLALTEENIQPSGAEQPEVSPQTEQIVKKLVDAYGVDLSQPGARLSLDMPTLPDRWMIANLDGQHLSLTRYFEEDNGVVTPDVSMMFPLGSTSEGPKALPQRAMTDQEILDTVSGHVAKAQRDRARGQLFPVLLEAPDILKRLEKEGVVPIVESPNPFRIWQTDEHEAWWTAHPQAHEQYLQAMEKRKDVLASLYLGILIGYSFGEDILHPDRKPLPPLPWESGK